MCVCVFFKNGKHFFYFIFVILCCSGCCGCCVFFGISVMVFSTLLVRKSSSFDLCGQNMLLKLDSNVFFLFDHLIAAERIFFYSFHYFSFSLFSFLLLLVPIDISMYMCTFLCFPCYNLMSPWTNRRFLCFWLNLSFPFDVELPLLTMQNREQRFYMLANWFFFIHSFHKFFLFNGKKNVEKKWNKIQIRTVLYFSIQKKGGGQEDIIKWREEKKLS